MYIYIHIYILFLKYSSPLWFISGYRIQLPVLYSGNLLFISSVCISLHMPIPNSQSIPCSTHPLPHLGNHKSVLYVHESVSISQISSFVLGHNFLRLCLHFGISFHTFSMYEWISACMYLHTGFKQTLDCILKISSTCFIVFTLS